ncbi:MAG: PilZ domain-containing protein [Myxococcota bacterium]
MNDDPSIRRQHRRIPTSIPVRISTIESLRDPWTGKAYFRASQETCANVSRGGVFVRTTELLDPGRRVLLELQLPNGSQVEAVGRVAWTRRSLASADLDNAETGVGVEFLGGATEQLAALDEFLLRVDDEPAEDRDN